MPFGKIGLVTNKDGDKNSVDGLKINFTIPTQVPNNYFQFKQFIVQQDQCAMKVSTDACIFGAYVTSTIIRKELMAATILDIGTGTGLLSLMVAQKTNAIIDGLEIDESAFRQAVYNFERSPWKNRLNIINGDALLFYPEKKYDCIISNPPFFEGDLKSGDGKKNAAKHDTMLTLEKLLFVIDRHLSPHGFFAVLLPNQRVDYFMQIAMAANYFPGLQLSVRHTGKHRVSRSILFFSHQKTTVVYDELVIKNADGNYTREFINLLEDYYLNL